MSNIRWYGPTLVLLLTVLVVMIAGPRMVRQLAYAQTDARITLIKDELADSPFLEQLSNSFRQVSEVVEPSVVHVKVLSRHARRPSAQPRDLREWFFGPRRDFPLEEQPQPEQDFDEYDAPQEIGNGSGWVYDNNGHIITNNHVVENADEIRLRFNDGAEYTAEVVGTDPKTDVAVLKVDAAELHPATLARSSVEQGDLVFAFGSPFRFQFSMSMGIVSAKGRRLGIVGAGGYENFIQTDAAINPGNSGGPLTNIRGQVVGMNTAIASRNGQYNGLGFAIPIDMVQSVAEQLIKSGRVRRGFLGIALDYKELTPELAKTFGFEGKGVLVVDTTDNSPAAKAGLRAGDIVTEVNGTRVTAIPQLRRMIAGFAPGTTVDVTYFREGKTHETKVTLAELDPEVAKAAPRGEVGEGDAAAPADREAAMDTLRKLGIENIEDFTEDMASRMGARFVPGVIITEVRPSSLAGSRGLRRGAVVTSVQGEDVDSVGSLLKAFGQYDAGSVVRLRVLRWNRSERMFVPGFEVFELPKD